MDIQALQEEKAAIERKIEQARAAARDGAISKIIAIMAEAGVSAADLGFTPPSRPASSKPRRGKSNRPPKYVDPATGQTWVGRGKRPDWINAAVANGAKLEAFAVPSVSQ